MKNLEQIHLLNKLSLLGNVIPLKLSVDCNQIIKSISKYKQHIKPYNPKKKGLNRYGLSITSLDGGFTGVPDLDCLLEYNKVNQTNFMESDFRKWTPFFQNCDTLKTTLEPFHKYIARSHILKLNKGGFFPTHRDMAFFVFRLFIPISNSTDYVFILDEKQQFFEKCKVYVINTWLRHSLFSFTDNTLFTIFNIDLKTETLDILLDHLDERMPQSLV